MRHYTSVQQLGQLGLRTDGTFEAVTDGKALKHNAINTPGILHNSYKRVIKAPNDPAPYMLVQLKLDYSLQLAAG